MGAKPMLTATLRESLICRSSKINRGKELARPKPATPRPRDPEPEAPKKRKGRGEQCDCLPPLVKLHAQGHNAPGSESQQGEDQNLPLYTVRWAAHHAPAREGWGCAECRLSYCRRQLSWKDPPRGRYPHSTLPVHATGWPCPELGKFGEIWLFLSAFVRVATATLPCPHSSWPEILNMSPPDSQVCWNRAHKKFHKLHDRHDLDAFQHCRSRAQLPVRSVKVDHGLPMLQRGALGSSRCVP